MKVTLWGTRGSLASPGPDTARYGGNTSCVEVQGRDGTVLILDAGTGIRRLGLVLPRTLRRVDVLLTHLHMDHIQGLAFFRLLRTPGVEVHIWGPASATLSLRARLTRYLSPPLFPVFLRDMQSTLFLHEVPFGSAPRSLRSGTSQGRLYGDFEVGEFRVSSALVCHPDPTVGYRIAASGAVLTYLPDHEPALGVDRFPWSRDWTSGVGLARDADLLIHDAQYTGDEYMERIGFGHSSVPQAFAFAKMAEARHLVPFHHDPAHTDDDLDRLMAETMASARPQFAVTPGVEGGTFDLN
jgi:phosphoribosyl 1,2-cyclic phosphodiesterase